jgi:hypothetical protein
MTQISVGEITAATTEYVIGTLRGAVNCVGSASQGRGRRLVTTQSLHGQGG